MTLLYILLATLAGGLLSVAIAASLTVGLLALAIDAAIVVLALRTQVGGGS